MIGCEDTSFKNPIGTRKCDDSDVCRLMSINKGGSWRVKPGGERYAVRGVGFLGESESKLGRGG